MTAPEKFDQDTFARPRMEGFLMFALCWSPIWISIILLALGVIGPEQENGLNFQTVCADGTTSLSTGSGACAYHGGVEFYVPPDQQSEAMRQMDRVEAEIETNLRRDGLID